LPTMSAAEILRVVDGIAPLALAFSSMNTRPVSSFEGGV
jgi:hypothetical protein